MEHAFLQSETLTLVKCSLLCPDMAAFAKRVNESLPVATVGAGATAGAAAAAALKEASFLKRSEWSFWLIMRTYPLWRTNMPR